MIDFSTLKEEIATRLLPRSDLVINHDGPFLIGAEPPVKVGTAQSPMAESGVPSNPSNKEWCVADLHPAQNVDVGKLPDLNGFPSNPEQDYSTPTNDNPYDARMATMPESTAKGEIKLPP
jgi:hypothetical protein